MDKKGKVSFSLRFATWIVEHPKKSLFLALLVSFIFLPWLLNWEERHDVRIWFRETDQNIRVLDQFEKQFGNDESLVIIFNSPSGIFNNKNVKTLISLTEDLWQLPEVVRVDSLSNYNFTDVEVDDIIVSPFLEEDRINEKYLLERKKTALNHEVLPSYLISKDGRSAMIFCRLITVLGSSPNYQKIVEAAKTILKNYEGKGDHRFYILGAAAVNDAFREVANNDLKRLMPFLWLIIILYLLVTFRSFYAMVIPLFVTIFSIGSTLGLCFFLGLKFNSILGVLPGILVSISIADSVHILVSYLQFKGKGIDKKNAAIKSLEKNMLPTILTTVSTMIGFFSLLTTELIPVRHLGLLAGVGSSFAWFITILFVGPLIGIIDFSVPAIFKERELLKKGKSISKSSVDFIFKFRKTIIFIFATFTVLSFFLGIQNKVNADPYSYFKPHLPISIANIFLKEEFKGGGGPEIIIKTNKLDGAKDPLFLNKVDALKKWIKKDSRVIKIIDILDIIKDVNRSLHLGKQKYYSLPQDQKRIAENLLLYSLGLPQGMEINNRINLGNDAIRMTILWSISETEDWLKQAKLIEEKARSMGLDATVTGKFYLFQRMMDYVVWTFFKSITMALILVGLLMMVLFRSVKIGVISLIPNIIPLAFGGAIMKLSGMNLNIGTSLVASVCLGIAVDDTIHFLSNYFRLKKDGLTEQDCIEEIFTYTGKALIITTLILASGFGVYLFGDFVPNRDFALLCSLVLIMALLVDLIFLPALLLEIDSWKREK